MEMVTREQRSLFVTRTAGGGQICPSPLTLLTDHLYRHDSGFYPPFSGMDFSMVTSRKKSDLDPSTENPKWRQEKRKQQLITFERLN